MRQPIEAREQACDLALFELLGETGQAIAPDDCQAGKLYWGEGRDNELGICIGPADNGLVWFKSWTRDRDQDRLILQLHHDQESRSGTYKPFVELESAPVTSDKTEIIAWLIGKTVELSTDRIDWLNAMPAHLKASRHHPCLVEDEQARLSALRQALLDA